MIRIVFVNINVLHIAGRFAETPVRSKFPDMSEPKLKVEKGALHLYIFDAVNKHVPSLR